MSCPHMSSATGKPHGPRRNGGATAQHIQAGAPSDPASALTAQLFQDLQGTWVGNKGFNIIALPSEGSKPTDKGAFLLLVQPYLESLTFTNAGAPARNRGGDVDQFISALTYEQRVTDSNTSELLHIEDGMFLNLSNIVDNEGNQQPVPTFNIARSGTIPHGDSIMLLGKPPVSAEGPPNIPPISSLPTNVGTPPLGYTDPYLNQSVPGINVATPTETLMQQLKDQAAQGFEVLQTVTFSLSSSNGGSVANIPFIKQRANAAKVDAIFWLEKVRDKTTGSEFDQLQYIQVIDLDFHQSFGGDGLITWPHVTINTMVKQ